MVRKCFVSRVQYAHNCHDWIMVSRQVVLLMRFMEIGPDHSCLLMFLPTHPGPGLEIHVLHILHGQITMRMVPRKKALEVI